MHNSNFFDQLRNEFLRCYPENSEQQVWQVYRLALESEAYADLNEHERSNLFFGLQSLIELKRLVHNYVAQADPEFARPFLAKQAEQSPLI